MLFKINRNVKTEAVVIMIIASFLLFLSFYKAYITSFTHDESLTFIYYAKSSLKTSLLFLENPTANNHILNTLLMSISSHILGNSELALRLPNIVAHFFFLYFSYLLIQKISPARWFIIPFYIIININPFLLDFFSLARGYGLTVTFSTISLYNFLIYYETYERRKLSLTLFFATLAVLSNLSALYFFCGIILTYNTLLLATFKKTEKGFVKFFLQENKLPLIYSIALFAFISIPIITLSKNGQFYFGGDNNFWSDTISSLVYSSLYNQFYNGFGELLLKTTLIISTLASIPFLLKDFIKRSDFGKLSIVSILIFFTVITVIIQHYILGSKFIVGRTATFLLPIISTTLCLITAQAAGFKFLKIPALILSFIIASVVVFHTFNSYSLKSHLDWRYDKNTKEMLSTLESIVDKTSDPKVSLGINWLFEPTINYYIKTKELNWLEKVNRDGINESQNYFYIFETDTASLKNINYSVVQRFEDTNTLLVRRK